jgi:hypothetical protein
MFTATLAITGFVLETALIVRAARGRFLSHFRFFYSYIAFVLAGTAASLALYRFLPIHHKSFFWFYFLITLVAEFAVLVEMSDHIFDPYPAIRQLGRFITLCTGTAFFFLYILPSLLQSRPSGITILDLVKRSSLTKAVIIIVLLAAARYYRLPLGRNISGMMLGFSGYLAINVANFALAEKYGAELYGRTFSVVGPLSFALGLLVWTIALWRYEPAIAVGWKPLEDYAGTSEPLRYQLGRFNTTLSRLLGK